MKKPLKIAIWLTVVAVIFGGGYAVFRPTPVVYETETLARGTVVSEVSVTGSLQPLERVSLEPEVSGRVVEIAVQEGDEVKAGDLLIALDRRDTQARIRSQQAALDASRAELARLVAGATSEDLALSERAVDSAAARLDAARQAALDAAVSLEDARRTAVAAREKAAAQVDAKLHDFLDDLGKAVTDAGDALNRLDNPLYYSGGQLTFNSSNSQYVINAVSTRGDAKAAYDDLEAQVIALRAADADLAAVRAAYPEVVARLGRIKSHLDASALVLTAAADLSSTTLTTYQLNVSTAQGSVSAAINTIVSDKTGLDVQEALNYSEVTAADNAVNAASSALNVAGAGVTSAELSLAQSRAELDYKRSGTRPESIAAQRARVAAEEASLSALASDLSKRELRAPLDGVVTEVNVKRGESVQPGRAAVAMNASGRFEIVSNISEVDIAKVQVGQGVGITLDAFSGGEEWTGKVIKIFPAEKVVEGVIFYETRVLFDQDDERLKSGMTANLVIETGRREDVVRLPLRAIKEEDGARTVRVLVGGEAEERSVKLGLQNNDYVEVTEGVAVGEAVIVGENR